MSEWNATHVRANTARYPDNPELEEALQRFRQACDYYSMQVERRYKVINTVPVQEAWDHFIKLRNRHEHHC